MPRLLRRRELIAAGAAGLALPDLAAASALGSATTVPDVLRKLIEVELELLVGYERVLAAGVLSPAAHSVATQFPAHEREHANVLTFELARRGGYPPSGAAKPTPPTNSPDAVRYLIELETRAEGAYYAAMARLSEPALIRLAAEIMCSEAQHWSALSALLHSGDVYSAVPTASVTGG